MSTTTPQTLKGFRDFLPEEKRKRDYVANKVKETFEIFGFDPLETPTLEYASLLMGKYGAEADKLIYTFKDKGDREVALRYDQTVPSARILAQYRDLPRYFRRYQIQNVYRAEKPQSGRFREFTQCDIDIFGSTSFLADAEIITTTYFAFRNVGFANIILSVNDRQTLFKHLDPFATRNVSVFSIIQSVDKLEKIGEEGVLKELESKGLNSLSTKKALKQIQNARLSNELEKIINASISLGVPREALTFTPTLARGLDYYTGMIFEVVLPEYSAGSCGGGGRYDKLIYQLGGIDVPAVGIAFGFDRMVEAAEQLNIMPRDNNSTTVLVTIFDETTLQSSLQISNTLRTAGIKTEQYPSQDRLDKQLKHADKKQIPYVIIIGPEEKEKGTVKLKNMKTREQKEFNQRELLIFLISN